MSTFRRDPYEHLRRGHGKRSCDVRASYMHGGAVSPRRYLSDRRSEWPSCRDTTAPSMQDRPRKSPVAIGGNVCGEKFLFFAMQEGAKIEERCSALTWGKAAFWRPRLGFRMPRRGSNKSQVPCADLAVCRSSGINVDETFEVQTAYTQWEPVSRRAHKPKSWPVCGHTAAAFRGERS